VIPLQHGATDPVDMVLTVAFVVVVNVVFLLVKKFSG
jgi:hypothetical protein